MSQPPAPTSRALLALGAVAVTLCAAAAWAEPPAADAPAADLPTQATAVQPGTSSSSQPAPAAEIAHGIAPEQGSLQVNAVARASALRTSDFGVDRNGARSGDAPQGLSRITARADLDSGRRFGMFSVQAALGADVATGTFAGRPTLAGDKLPGNRYEGFAPTQAWAGLSVRDAATLRVGLTTSQWGMGLVANDGNHALDGRRDDWFVLPTTGDRVWRGQLVVQPFGRTKGPLRGLFLAGGADLVREDANAILANGDHAYQGVFAARLFFSKVRSAGLYYVHRDQTFGSGSHPFLRVDVVDGAFDFDFRSAGHGLRVQGEGALILGRTNLAPTPSFPEHDVRQSAAVARARWQAGVTGLRAELDAGWLSGDDNIEDANQNAFKANPNFQQGILMFSQVLGWQSGRARITASDPQYVGYPSADLDRIATGGSVTSAVTVFPKVGWKASEALEVYGGALLAWSPRIPVDPFSTRTVGGGSPRNFLSHAPDGHHLGTELDLGVVATVAPVKWPVAVAVRAEYGLLLPGGALAGLEADSPIHGGRVTLALLPAAPQP